jgi:hypothetical protein
MRITTIRTPFALPGSMQWLLSPHTQTKETQPPIQSTQQRSWLSTSSTALQATTPNNPTTSHISLQAHITNTLLLVRLVAMLLIPVCKASMRNSMVRITGTVDCDTTARFHVPGLRLTLISPELDACNVICQHHHKPHATLCVLQSLASAVVS